MSFYFLDTSNNTSTKTFFTREVYLIDNFKANMLINNDILESKKFAIDLEKDEIYIDSCNITVFIDVQKRFNDFV